MKVRSPRVGAMLLCNVILREVEGVWRSAETLAGPHGRCSDSGSFGAAGLWASGISFEATGGDVGAGGFVASVALSILAFKGFTTITNSGAEITDPHRNVGRAIVLSIAICVVVYLLVAFAVGSSLPLDRIVAAKDYALAEAARWRDMDHDHHHAASDIPAGTETAKDPVRGMTVAVKPDGVWPLSKLRSSSGMSHARVRPGSLATARP